MPDKLFSGRFIFTIITAIVFMWASITGVLSNDQIVSIIMLIIGFYFNKPREEKKI